MSSAKSRSLGQIASGITVLSLVGAIPTIGLLSTETL